MTPDERFWYERGRYEAEQELRLRIADDLRAVAALYSDTTNDYHCAVRASYLSAADRVLPSLPNVTIGPLRPADPIPHVPDTSGDLDCDDDHD